MKDNLDLIEAIKISKEKIPKYDWILEIYTEEQLENARINMVVTPDDEKLIENIIKTIQISEDVPDEAIYELVFYAVMTSDPQDIEFVEKHGELCERCGWCCKSLPIEVRKTDIQTLGDYKGFKFVGKERFEIILPCIYQNDDNTCSVYDKRPNSCRTYPVGYKNGTLVIQRTLKCKYIFNFLVQKSIGFIERAWGKKNAKIHRRANGGNVKRIRRNNRNNKHR